jgi:transcriptional regulator with XRE-family HTH domain
LKSEQGICYTHDMNETKQIKRKRSEVVDTGVFVARVRALMQQKGLSPSELADQGDLARSALTQFLAGKTKPSADALVKLADMLDASTDYLLGRSDESELADLLRHAKINELVQLFIQLSVTDQERVTEMIRLMARTTTTISSL